MSEAQPVFQWTVKARRRLHSGLTGDQGMERIMGRIEQVLASAFNGAPMIVQDKMLGFRARPNQHILLVEVSRGPLEGAYVVKIGPVGKLEQEIAAWDKCRPHGLRHDMVFLDLVEGHRDGTDTAEPLMCLVYGDAQQFIGVSETLTLESAALDAVHLGVPTLASVREVLVQLFERIGYLLYEGSDEDDPERADFTLALPRLEEGLHVWETQESLRAIRATVHNALQAQQGVERFIEPVSYMRYVAQHFGFGPRPTYPAGLAEPPRRKLVPAMLRGRGHGDLHGRNILVGRVRDRVLWPTVFDYGDMGPHNLLGWDFVKLETELKIRAHHLLLTELQPEAFICRLHSFEIELNKATESCHGQEHWELGGEKDPLERLRSLVLQIRQLAAIHLGRNRGRPRRWLEEYYFLLTAYGIHAGRFENLIDRELLALHVAAGTAAARLAWPGERVHQERTFLGLDSPREVPALRQGVSTAAEVLALPTVTHGTPLEKARLWVRSGDPALIAAAVELLKGLLKRYPSAPDIGPELALAQTAAGRPGEAELTLLALERVFRTPAEEHLCRWGRLFKDEGDRFFLGLEVGSHGPRLEQASAYYGQALAMYDQAERIRRGHYPGINKATLLMLLGALARSRGANEESDRYLAEASATARDLLDRRPRWPFDKPDDNIWHLATAGEAYLICEPTQAAEQYRMALDTRNLQQMHRTSMRRQVERILQSFKLLNRAVPESFDDLDRLFAAGPGEKGLLPGQP
jgi:hypothetical protein